MPQLLRLCSRAWKLQLWSSRAAATEACLPYSLCSATKEATAGRSPWTTTREQQPHLSTTREKPAQQWGSSSAKNDFFLIVWKHKGPRKAKVILREQHSWRYHAPWFQIIPQTYSKNSMVSTQKQIHRSMEEKRQTRINPHLHSQLIYEKRGKNTNWQEKTVSSIHGVKKTGQP